MSSGGQERPGNVTAERGAETTAAREPEPGGEKGEGQDNSVPAWAPNSGGNAPGNWERKRRFQENNLVCKLIKGVVSGVKKEAVTWRKFCRNCGDLLRARTP